MIQVVVLEEDGQLSILSSMPQVHVLILRNRPAPWTNVCEVDGHLLEVFATNQVATCDPELVAKFARIIAEPMTKRVQEFVG